MSLGRSVTMCSPIGSFEKWAVPGGWRARGGRLFEVQPPRLPWCVVVEVLWCSRRFCWSLRVCAGCLGYSGRAVTGECQRPIPLQKLTAGISKVNV